MSAQSPPGRSLVLVAGSGRSGTSLFGGILQRLGYHVPKPEVAADVTNPKGFAESRWVVDFHSRLLAASKVQVSDSRPQAWALTAREGSYERNAVALRTWLDQEFDANPRLIIKDPRLSWFLPLWRRCAADLGVTPAFVTMLRHPAAVVDSKQRYYGTWQGNVSRTAGWVNLMLFTERATRDAPRIFVRYGDLLDDWTTVLSRVGDILGLSIVQTASAARLREVHQFIDPTLARSNDTWGDVRMPAALRDQAEHAWELLSALAEKDAASPEEVAALDAAREAYIDLYQDAEAIAQSSISAMRAAAPPAAKVAPARKPVIPGLHLVPASLRHKIPLSTRKRILRSVRAVRARARKRAAAAKP